jgi:hypothetical protein
MKTATPATLRALSTSSRALPAPASPCGGTMSKLQLLGQRCPVMGKAMAVQTAKNRAAGSVRAFSNHSKTGKAKIHTSSNKEARAVERPLFEGRDNGMFKSQKNLFTSLSHLIVSNLAPQLLLVFTRTERPHPHPQPHPLPPLASNLLANSTMKPFTILSSRRNTRINPTVTSTISTVWQRSFHARTCPTRRIE